MQEHQSMRTSSKPEDEALQVTEKGARGARPVLQEVITVEQPEAVYGLRPFPSRGEIVTNSLVNELLRQSMLASICSPAVDQFDAYRRQSLIS